MQNKIIELNTKDTYKLIDVEGWLRSNSVNKFLLDDYPEILEGFELDSVKHIRYTNPHAQADNCLMGMYKEDAVISHEEFDFFRKIGN